jgi:hypothetical protein
LSQVDDKGISVREHLEQVERQTKRRPKELEPVEFPDHMAHVWFAFITLSRRRSVGFSGPNRITYTEIEDYCRGTATVLSLLDKEAIMSLDDVYMKVINERSRSGS